MKWFLWLVIGVAAGFAIAHRMTKPGQGKPLFGDIDAKARDFGAAVADGYHRREAELRSAIGDAENTITDFTNN